MENSHSLTAIPVLYRNLGSLPVFALHTDAVLFNAIADSLETVYPDSKFVKSLRADAVNRFDDLKLMERLSDAEEVGYLDIELPGLDGKNKKLSEVDSKVVLLYFWSAADPQQNMFNVEVLKKLYNDYHHRGFDIYQVSLDVDKVQWATTVMGQNLPWTNVCDIRGAASEYVTLYNLLYQTEDGNIGIAVPAAFVINDGELVDGEIVDEASFRKLLEKLL
jgi:peroxiredoxin